MTFPTCQECGKEILPTQEAFHKRGVPVLHRSHFHFPKSRKKRPLYNGNLLREAVAHEVTEPMAIRKQRFFAAHGGAVYWFETQTERALWVLAQPGARRLSLDEALEMMERRVS